MAEAASARRATSASRAGRGRQNGRRPLDSLSRLQRLADDSPRVAQLLRLQALANPTERPDARLQGIGPLSGLPMDQARLRNNQKPTVVSPIGIQIPAGMKINEASAAATHKPHSSVWQKVSRKPKKQVVVKRNGLKKVAFKKTLPAKRQVMTVRNRIDDYDSGVIRSITLPSGVNPGPQKEAQKVAAFLGGSWVGGHMVNDQLGGTGGFSNIVPITSSMNGKHKTIENRANNELTNGRRTAVKYRMNINKRETRVNGLKTVKNLPVEFKQTLEIYPAGGAAYTVNGNVLKHP